MVVVRSERPGDVAAIHAVHAASFPTDLEAGLVALLRGAGRLLVSLVYAADEKPVVAIVRPATVAVILLGLWAALRRTKMDADAQTTTWFAVAIPLAVWLIAIWIVAASGALQARSGALPLLPMALVLPIAVGLFALMRSASIAAAIDVASPAWLIGLQVYRVLGRRHP